MIKNVIFDVGGVLLKWSPPTFLKNLNLPQSFQEVFASLLWAAHDGGLLSREEVVEKLPEHFNKETFSYCIKNLSEQLEPIPEMIDLFHALRRQGYNVFILSNMPGEMHQELARLHDFFKHPKAEIFSYQIKAIKPQPQIYQALLQKYQLYPEETLFIDDHFDNVQAAEKLNIKTIHCHSPGQVREELAQYLIHARNTGDLD
jgi:HAD superfamily hydrolase (TIGR01509 family)